MLVATSKHHHRMLMNTTAALWLKPNARLWSGLLLASLLFGSMALLPYLHRYYGSLPWLDYPILLPASQVNTPQPQQHTLAGLLADSGPLSGIQPPSQLLFYQLAAEFDQHFCIGDEVLLSLDQHQARGLLLMKIAAGSSQPHIQLGIRLFPPFAAAFSQPASTNLRLKRLTYSSADWLRQHCLQPAIF
jgi:hypothetical protein